MQIYTSCPACGKSLILDTRHREPYAVIGQQTVVAKERCGECRQEVIVNITITAGG
jgi:ribosomal protein S27AE